MTSDVDTWSAQLVGRTLAGRYQLVRVLGAGGLGVVFEAKHVTVGKRVAIKVLLPDVRGNDRIVERFHREARAAAACAREGVVDVLDFDRDPECGPFIVMEYIDGETLSAHLNRLGPLPIADAVTICRAVLATLETVHAAGIVHRDLKPSNVMLTRTLEGRDIVKVVDFGVARDREARTGPALTSPGAVLGTPGYMAPEQAGGHEDVDARADLYAVGAILYGCLAGRPPFGHLHGNEAVRAALMGSPEALERLRPGLPRELIAVVEQAMARNRLDRFPDAHRMHAALVAAVERQPSALPPERAVPSTNQLAAVSGHVGAPRMVDAPTMQVTLDATQAATAHGEATRRPSRVGLWLAMAAALLVFVGFAGVVGWYAVDRFGDPPDVDTSHWKTIEHRRVTFRAPPDWGILSSSNPMVDRAWGPVVRKKGVPPHVAISLDAVNMTTLDDYIWTGRYRNREAGGREMMMGDAEVGVPAVRIETLFDAMSPPYRETVIVTMIDGIGYLVRCFNAPDDDQGLAICRNVARSVRLSATPARPTATPPRSTTPAPAKARR